MKIVERWGSGIRRIFDSFREAGLPLPAARAYRADSSLENIWQYISRRKNVTFSQMLAELDVGRRTLAYRLKELNAKGLIVRTGNTRSAVWNAVTR